VTRGRTGFDEDADVRAARRGAPGHVKKGQTCNSERQRRCCSRGLNKPSRDDDYSFRLEAWITDNNQTGPSELLAQEG
jgi:hypothetical protein